MVIIRRNPDGSIANQQDNPQTPRHPALASKAGMAALSEAGRSGIVLMH